MVEEGGSEKLNKILIEGKNLIRRKDLLKYISSIFEGLSLRNIESFQEIIYFFYSLH